MNDNEKSHQINIIDCNSAEEFWDKLDPRHPFGNKENSGKYIIFRGQRDADWSLKPKIFRDEYSDFLSIRRKIEHLNKPNTYCQLEQKFLFQFILSCERTGLPLYKDSRKIKEKYFKRDSRKGYPTEPGEWPIDELYELIALAQHHGIPTRLLDWTRRSYVAAFFAANSALDVELKKNKDLRLAVWGLDYKIFKNDNNIDFLEVPGYTSQNISSQSGCFTIYKNDIGKVGTAKNVNEINIHKMVPEEFPFPLEESIEPKNKIYLWKITLPIKYIKTVLSYCSLHSITNATMFPGYDGCAKHAMDVIYKMKHFDS